MLAPFKKSNFFSLILTQLTFSTSEQTKEFLEWIHSEERLFRLKTSIRGTRMCHSSSQFLCFPRFGTYLSFVADTLFPRNLKGSSILDANVIENELFSFVIGNNLKGSKISPGFFLRTKKNKQFMICWNILTNSTPLYFVRWIWVNVFDLSPEVFQFYTCNVQRDIVQICIFNLGTTSGHKVVACRNPYSFCNHIHINFHSTKVLCSN